MSAPTVREIARAVDRAWQVPGLYKRDEAAFLYQLARRKGELVEIGCYLGRTTAILLQAAAIWGARVTSVDPFEALPARFETATAAKWLRNLRRVGLEPPELLQVRSDAAAQRYDREIALLFIDGDHTYEGVADDLARWAGKVKVGGVLALHDMFFPSVTGVCQAVVEWWSRERDGSRERDASRERDEARPRWQLVGLRDFTIAFRRIR